MEVCDARHPFLQSVQLKLIFPEPIPEFESGVMNPPSGYPV
jgi:hypothetical protein